MPCFFRNINYIKRIVSKRRNFVKKVISCLLLGCSVLSAKLPTSEEIRNEAKFFVEGMQKKYQDSVDDVKKIFEIECLFKDMAFLGISGKKEEIVSNLETLISLVNTLYNNPNQDTIGIRESMGFFRAVQMALVVEREDLVQDLSKGFFVVHLDSEQVIQAGIKSFLAINEKEKAKTFLKKALKETKPELKVKILVNWGELLEDKDFERDLLKNSLDFDKLSSKGQSLFLDKLFELQDDETLGRYGALLIHKLVGQSFLARFDAKKVLAETRALLKIVDLTAKKGERKKAIRAAEMILKDKKIEELKEFIQKTKKELGFWGRWNPFVR